MRDGAQRRGGKKDDGGAGDPSGTPRPSGSSDTSSAQDGKQRNRTRSRTGGPPSAAERQPIRFHSGKYNDRKLCEIPGLIRKALFIPETRALDTLFQEMQSTKIHMVIVVDEYGQTAGIVTMEDILEEIVGNIVDEYDSEEEMITPLPDGSWLMRGMTPLEDADEAAGIGFDEEEKNEFDTLNGFLIARLDRIPSESETFIIKAHGFEFRVLYVQNKMVRTVKVVRCPEEKAADDAGNSSEEI